MKNETLQDINTTKVKKSQDYELLKVSGRGRIYNSLLFKKQKKIAIHQENF